VFRQVPSIVKHTADFDLSIPFTIDEDMTKSPDAITRNSVLRLNCTFSRIWRGNAARSSDEFNSI
jgi:hypothetical protein